MIPTILGTSDNEAAPSERILWKPSWIYYVLLLLVENDFKEEGTSELRESADSDTVIGVELELDKSEVAGWDDSLSVSIGDLITNKSSSVLSTDIGSYDEVTVK